MGNITTAKAITFIDTETTHLDPSKSAILSISIMTDWEDGNQDVWTTKIKPKEIEMKFASKEALEVCGYTEKEWENAPYFEEVAEEIAKRIKFGPVVGHNIQFDISHLKASFLRRGWREPRFGERYSSLSKIFKVGYPQIDTCSLAYLFLPTEKQNLNALREHFNIDTNRAHSADTDVEDCRHVFYQIMKKILT